MWCQPDVPDPGKQTLPRARELSSGQAPLVSTHCGGFLDRVSWASRGGLGMPRGPRSPRDFLGFPRRLRWRRVGGCRVGRGAVMAKSHGSSGDSTGHPGALVLNVALMGTEARQAGDSGRWPSSPPRALCLFLQETSQKGRCPRQHRQRSLRAAHVPQAPPGHRRHRCPPGRPSCAVILRAPVQKGA